MFNAWAIPVFEHIHGKKIASMLADILFPNVTERTVRNWISGKIKNHQAAINKIDAAGTTKLRQHLLKKDYTPEDVERIIQNQPQNIGPLGSFVYFCSPLENHYPETLKLACKIDEISKELYEAKAKKDIDAFILKLLSVDYLTEEYLVNIDEMDESICETKERIINSKNWSDLDKPLKLILFNALMSLMALWNIEFCKSYFDQFEAVPIFIWFQPRINPTVKKGADGNFKKQRDLIHLPNRRLIDFMACLRFYKKNRKWPQEIPSVAELSIWTAEDKKNYVEERKIVCWREGRRLTYKEFSNFWNAMFFFCEEKQRPSPPFPLLFASTTWSKLFVQGSKEKPELSVYINFEKYFIYWWERHEKKAKNNGASFGDAAWLTLLN
ncbi:MULTISPECIES: hypothetical protein [Giesbergeria]|uniref:Uncharacterized protein n=1 Tax=Giesbergeria sinuosa TaxID=80883 RepID=A0ABV9QHG7_9BURK